MDNHAGRLPRHEAQSPAGGSPPLEVEAKLLVPHAGDLRVIARLDRLGAYRLRPRGKVHLHSLYVDTPELILARSGVALRLRRHHRRWEVTAKWGGRVEGTLHERPELTAPLSRAPSIPFALPEGALQIRLQALVAARPLTPILVTEIERRLLDVVPPEAGTEPGTSEEPIAELALDRVRLAQPESPETAEQQRTVARYCEVEIEQRHGSRQDVEGLSQILQQQFGLRPSRDSKFVRGLSLLYGSSLLEAGEPPLPGADDTMEEAARKVFAVHLGRLRQHDPGTRAGEDPEALHDMRVAVRRLRAALRVFQAAIPRRLHDSMKRELAWLGHCLGAVRDVDVQLGRLIPSEPDRALISAEQRAALAALEEHLQSERQKRRAELLAALNSPRYLRLLVRLERFSRSPARRRPRAAEARAPVAVAGGRAIEKALSRLLKRGRRIQRAGASPSVEDLHQLRIRAKRLRYLLEFLRELTGKPGRRLVKRLVELQDLLGAHQDAVVAADLIRRYAAASEGGASSETLLGLGMLIGAQQHMAARARADFRKTWRRFADKRTRSELRGALRRLGATTNKPMSSASAEKAGSNPREET
jgi:inorganic triphosphatase YgiF